MPRREQAQQLLRPGFQTETRKLIPVIAAILLIAEMRDSQIRTCLGVVEVLGVNDIFGATFIERCVRGIFLLERKIVL